jgi:hypothetical protein
MYAFMRACMHEKARTHDELPTGGFPVCPGAGCAGAACPGAGCGAAAGAACFFTSSCEATVFFASADAGLSSGLGFCAGCVYICVYLYTHKRTDTCFVWWRWCVHIYNCWYTHIHKKMCIHTYTYTHTHFACTSIRIQAPH